LNCRAGIKQIVIYPTVKPGLLMTGSQGESWLAWRSPVAAPQVQVKASERNIFSASPIPGKHDLRGQHH